MEGFSTSVLDVKSKYTKTGRNVGTLTVTDEEQRKSAPTSKQPEAARDPMESKNKKWILSGNC